MPEYNDQMELNVKFSSDISFIASDACDRYLLQMYIAKGIQEAFELVGSGCNHFTELYLRTAEQTLAFDDVAPVVRGRWIKAKGNWCTPGGDPVWECSECGKGMHVYGVEHGSYGSDVADGQWVSCPNCGAKMEAQDG